MAFAAAPTEAGGDKLHFLTSDGNVAGGWFGVDEGVTGTGANTVAFAAIATHVHDDAAGSPGGLATTSVPLVLVGGVRDDVLGGLTPVAGDAVYLLVDANGALWTHDNVLDAALAGSELQVDIVTMPAVDTELPAAAALSDATVNPTVPAVGAHLMGWNETTWDRLVSSIVNGLEVDVTRVQGNVAVTHTGLTDLAAAINANRMDVNIAASIALDVSGATVTVDMGADNDVTVDGSVAHDALDSGGLGPVKIGGRAQASEAQPEEVADNDRVDALFDRSGYLRVRGDFDPSFADINDAVSGDNTIIVAQAAGKRIAVWSILIVADGTVDVRWEDGAAGTALTGQIPLQAREGYSISAGGIVPLFVGSAATLLNLELSAAVAVHGFVSYSVIDD